MTKNIMKSLILFSFILTASGCSSKPIVPSKPNLHYWKKLNLNNLQVGMSKSIILSAWSSRQEEPVAPLIIRASKMVFNPNQELIEVGEMPMISAQGNITNFWFLFINGYLVQWGEPSDWKNVSARYEISYNPSPSVNY